MKKIKLLYAIILFVMFTLVSCKNDLTYLDGKNPNTEKSNNGNFEYTDSDDKPVEYNLVNGGDYLQFDDDYLYFRNGNPDVVNMSSNTLMRYNVKTGRITTLCPDPLCGHNTPDCHFFGMGNSYYIKNSKISFRRVYIQEKYKVDGTYDKVEVSGSFVSYDIKNNKLTVHERFEDSGGGEYQYQLYVEDYRYYYDIVHDEKTDIWQTLLSRMDLNNSKIMRLSEENIFDNGGEYGLGNVSVQFLFALDSRIYMTDMKTIYSTDYEMNNKKIHASGNFPFGVKTDGKYIYYGVKADIESRYQLQSVHRMNFDGTGDIDLGIVTEDYLITEKYIYYMKSDAISIGKSKIYGYDGSEVELFNSELRRCSHDGTNDEQVYKFEGDMAYYRFIGYPCIIGNYIYGVYHYWVDSNNDGVFEDGDNYSSITNDDFNIMRINIETGEVYYIRLN